MVHLVKLGAATTPGIVANAGVGDEIRLWFDATKRHDWGSMSRAIMTAYARGAVLHLVETGDPEDREVASAHVQ